MLRATIACTFSTSQVPKVVRTCCFLYILTSKCVSSMFRPQRRALFEHFNLKKFSGAEVRWLYVLTSTCVSLCHSRMHFLKASTSESAPELRCLAPFDFECCFAPQRRALFRQLNFQKCSEHVMFLICSLRNVLRATTACNLSSLHLPL